MIFTLILVFMIAIYTSQSLACSQFGKHYPGDSAKTSSVFSVLYGGICTVFTLVFTACTGGLPLAISLPTVLLGLANGIVLTTYNQFLLKSSAAGPYSIVMIFMMSGGLIIPVLWSVIVDGNALNGLQWIAMVLTLVSFLILNMPKKGERVSFRFLWYCTVLGTANGIYAILMNHQQAMTANTENAAMIMLTFGTCSLLSLVILLIPSKGASFAPRTELRRCFTFNKPCLAWGLASALSASVAVNILLWILSKMNVAVVYAFIDGGVLLVSVLISLIFLGEKCTLTKVIGIIVATAAIVMLSI